MQEIQNKERLEFNLEKHHIRQLFDTPNLPFRLYRYEVGEMLNILRHTKKYLKFVVKGSVDLYAVRADGGRHMVRRCEGFTFLGDLEFCGKTAVMRYQEVTQAVYTIELPLEALRQTLQRDVRFLNFFWIPCPPSLPEHLWIWFAFQIYGKGCCTASDTNVRIKPSPA